MSEGRDRAAGFAATAGFLLVVLAWTAVVYRRVVGRAPGSGDVAGGLEGLFDLLLFAMLVTAGIGAAALGYFTRRRSHGAGPLIIALGAGTILASLLLMMANVLP